MEPQDGGVLFCATDTLANKLELFLAFVSLSLNMTDVVFVD